MTAHRLPNDLEQSEITQIGNPDKGEGIIFVRTTAKPDDATAGYADMCLLVDTTNNKVYFNKGTKTSCSFKEVTVAS